MSHAPIADGGAPPVGLRRFPREPESGRARTNGAPGAGQGPPTGGERTPTGAAKAPILSIRAVFTRFWPYVRPYRSKLALALASGLALPVLQGVTIWMFKILVDQVLVPGDVNAFWGIAAIYVGITVVVGLVSFGGSYLSRWLAQHFTLDLRTDLFRHLHSLSLDVLDRRRLGDTLSRLTSDVNAVERLVVSGITRTLGNVLRVLLFAGALFWLQWQLALAALVVTPLFVVVARSFALRIKDASREARHRSGLMSSVAEESLGNAPLVQAYQQQDCEVAHFHSEGTAKLVARLRVARLSAVFGPLVEVLELIGVLAVIGLGTWQMATGNLSLGGLLAFVGFLSQLYSPIRSLARLSNTIFSASAGAERIDELFTESSSVPEISHPRDLGRAFGVVEFERVSFRYPEASGDALTDVSFEVKPGEVLAIAGPSGAGKTTLAKLIARLHDATGGSVRIDGHDVKDLSIESLRANVALLLQETLVFHGSIYDNIAYGRPGATDDEIYRAARVARVDEFAKRLPDGYNSILGERGRSLSGGQRQRIAIARALVRDAPVLILDEPATGLDDDTSEQVLAPLRRLMVGRTTIVIAHDERSRALADRVITLNHGRTQTGDRKIRANAREEATL